MPASKSMRRIATIALSGLFAAQIVLGCNSPLVLDLDGNGIYTTRLDQGVNFDLDANGTKERCAWLNPWQNDGFLWLDLNNNGQVDSGRELFGNATLLPDGSTARNGFEALAQYDQREVGGNADGVISPSDAIWPFLKLWIDKNNDGLTTPNEVFSLDAKGVVAIGLEYRRRLQTDGNGNLKAFWGRFLQRTATGRVIRDVIDVYFQTSVN